MRLSQKTKYAIRALQVLAREYGKGPVLSAELANQRDMPKKFLEVILLEMKNHGLLQSRRGKGGGYQLTKAPEEIMLGQVVRLFDGPLAPIRCASETAYVKCAECPDANTCGTRLVMREVRDATARILDGTSLADLIQRVETATASKKARRSAKA